jgi:hypothetical protein
MGFHIKRARDELHPQLGGNDNSSFRGIAVNGLLRFVFVYLV